MIRMEKLGDLLGDPEREAGSSQGCPEPTRGHPEAGTLQFRKPSLSCASLEFQLKYRLQGHNHRTVSAASAKGGRTGNCRIPFKSKSPCVRCLQEAKNHMKLV